MLRRDEPKVSGWTIAVLVLLVTIFGLSITSVIMLAQHTKHMVPAPINATTLASTVPALGAPSNTAPGSEPSQRTALPSDDGATGREK